MVKCIKYSKRSNKRPRSIREQGWCSGESTLLPPMSPGFDSRTRRHMWVEFVVGSRPCSERFFSGYFGFPLSSKTNISRVQYNLDYCYEELYHEFLAREIAQALPMLLTINKLLYFICARARATSFFCRTSETLGMRQVASGNCGESGEIKYVK